MTQPPALVGNFLANGVNLICFVQSCSHGATLGGFLSLILKNLCNFAISNLKIYGYENEKLK